MSSSSLPHSLVVTSSTTLVNPHFCIVGTSPVGREVQVASSMVYSMKSSLVSKNAGIALGWLRLSFDYNPFIED